MEENLDRNNKINNQISDNTNKSNSDKKEVSKEEKINNQKIESNKNEIDTNLNKNLVTNLELKNDNNSTDKTIIKPKKELPIEKKPFQEFVNVHLIPSLIDELKQRGLEINNINLKNTYRPIAGDKCWVINCEIKETCNFWLSFEKEDISSLKSISLSKPNQKPSIIESFLIDEKRITLKLIISRVLQRLNGQKLIGVN